MNFTTLLRKNVEDHEKSSETHVGRSPIPVVLMDGGMGTTLEDMFHKDLSSRLWSAGIIQNDPEGLIQAHLAFLQSGCEIFSTATYQCAFETFASEGYADDTAITLMRKALLLADEARSRFLSVRGGSEESDAVGLQRPLLALALGPYGSTLSPAQEFDGLYPPPYGPQGCITTDGLASPAPNSTIGIAPTTFLPPELEEQAIEALTLFHLRRLLVFAQDAPSWSKIDCIAFETVPLLREGLAIRRAVGRLDEIMVASNSGWKMKPFWVSFVFPNGVCPQEEVKGGPHISVKTIAEEMMRSASSPMSEYSHRAPPLPSALGINCTHPSHLPVLLPEFSQCMSSCVNASEYRPWLVIYPNGGVVYDIYKRTWVEESKNGEEQWAAQLWDSVVTAGLQDRRRSKVDSAQSDIPWGGILLGGCCKTTPSHISALKRIVG